MNLFSIHLSDDADVSAVEDQLLELAAIAGVTLVAYDANIVTLDAPVSE